MIAFPDTGVICPGEANGRWTDEAVTWPILAASDGESTGDF